MPRPDIRKVDFHALNVLTKVHRHNSVTVAAEALGLSQSTVSFTITRLREQFDDALFVRVGHGIVPTVRCDEIVRFAHAVLEQLDDLNAAPDFDPATDGEKQHFRVSCNFYERHVLIPDLAARLFRIAPKSRLSVIHSGLHGHDQLQSRDCDILLSPLPETSDTFYRRKLLDDPYVCFVDRDSKLGRQEGPISIEDYLAAPHVAVIYEGGWTPYFMTILRSMGHDLTPNLSVPSYGSIDRMILGTDLVLTAPSRIASMFTSQCVARPVPFTGSVPIYMYWTARTHEAPPFRWLRGLVGEVSGAGEV